MNYQEEHIIGCPYCGESINILIDCSDGEQEYIEDCQVCCRPITFNVQSDGSSVQVNVRHENE
ncbi:MAG: CPXCG motif-containing cysteine-rich protein [Gammaproteobacteria bacterium]|nr:CPXCG motif-containing cysteine-rich protein [Gammaproteobacteria bacterium]